MDGRRVYRQRRSKDEILKAKSCKSGEYIGSLFLSPGSYCLTANPDQGQGAPGSKSVRASSKCCSDTAFLRAMPLKCQAHSQRTAKRQRGLITAASLPIREMRSA